MDGCVEEKQVEPEILWDQKRITEWHKATFPNATLASQLVKFNEEINELDISEDKREKELADVVIVAIVLFNRFNCKIGFLAINSFINQLLGSIMNPVEAQQYINRLVNEKMEINSKRTWEETASGEYRHVDVDKKEDKHD